MSKPISRRRLKVVYDADREHHTDAKILAVINHRVADKSCTDKTYGDMLNSLRQIHCYAIPDAQWVRVVQLRELQIKLAVVGDLMVGKHTCKGCKNKQAIVDYEKCFCIDCDRTGVPCNNCGARICDCPE